MNENTILQQVDALLDEMLSLSNARLASLQDAKQKLADIKAAIQSNTATEVMEAHIAIGETPRRFISFTVAADAPSIPTAQFEAEYESVLYFTKHLTAHILVNTPNTTTEELQRILTAAISDKIARSGYNLVFQNLTVKEEDELI